MKKVNTGVRRSFPLSGHWRIFIEKSLEINTSGYLTCEFLDRSRLIVCTQLTTQMRPCFLEHLVFPPHLTLLQEVTMSFTMKTRPHQLQMSEANALHSCQHLRPPVQLQSRQPQPSPEPLSLHFKGNVSLNHLLNDGDTIYHFKFTNCTAESKIYLDVTAKTQRMIWS